MQTQKAKRRRQLPLWHQRQLERRRQNLSISSTTANGLHWPSPIHPGYLKTKVRQTLPYLNPYPNPLSIECRHPDNSTSSLQLWRQRATMGHLWLVRGGLWSAAERKGQREEGKTCAEKRGEKEVGKEPSLGAADQTLLEVLANIGANDQSEYLRWYRPRFLRYFINKRFFFYIITTFRILQDYRYYEDPSDDFREEEGTLLPLWRFFYDKTKRLNVTDISFNTLYYDLFAVCFGSRK